MAKWLFYRSKYGVRRAGMKFEILGNIAALDDLRVICIWKNALRKTYLAKAQLSSGCVTPQSSVNN